jgi:hypothetical protein
MMTDEEKLRRLVELMEEIMRDIQRFLREIEPRWDDYR